MRAAAIILRKTALLHVRNDPRWIPLAPRGWTPRQPRSHRKNPLGAATTVLGKQHQAADLSTWGGVVPRPRNFVAGLPERLDLTGTLGATAYATRGASTRPQLDPRASTPPGGGGWKAQVILDGSVQSRCKLAVWRDGDGRGRPSSALVNAVDALAVEVVLESQADCADLERARAALSEALLAARAPAHGGSRLRGPRPTSPSAAHWTMTMTVAPAPPNVSARSAGSKSAEAVIVDDAGTIVAQRTLSDRNARSCLPLARAVGAWASLVLDAEMVRAKDDDGTLTTPASADEAAGTVQTRPSLRLVHTTPDPDSAATTTEGANPSSAKAEHALEVGSMAYVRNGMLATGGMVGVSPFVAVELANAWVLRPSVAFGRATQGAVGMSHVGGRTDLCRRIPGNYTERRGIEADLCAGIEAGVVTSQASQTMRGDSVGRAGIGPAATLRGELAAGVALEVRGLVGANFIQSALLGQAEAPLVFASAELGVSVRLP